MQDRMGDLTKDKCKEFVAIMHEKGFPPSIIKGYFDVIRKDSEIDSIIEYIKDNPDAKKNDINNKIMQRYLSANGVNI